MSRFKMLAIVAGAAVGVVASGAWAAPCSYQGQRVACQWSTACWGIDDAYGDPPGLSCDDYIANCIKDGALHAYDAASSEGQSECKGTLLAGNTCDQGNTIVGCCQWNSEGNYDPVNACKADDCNGGLNTYWAGVMCPADGSRPTEEPTWNGGAVTVLGCCKWSDLATNPTGGCWPATSATEVADCQTGTNIFWAGSCPGAPGSGTCGNIDDAIYKGDDDGPEGDMCKNNQGQQLYCQWETGCHSINNIYENQGMPCEALVASCVEEGVGMYTGVRESSSETGMTSLNPSNEYGVGVMCSEAGGTQVSGSNVILGRGKQASYHTLIAVKGRTITAVGASNTNVSVRLVNLNGKTVAKYKLKGGASVTLGKVPAGTYIIDVRRAKDGVKASERVTIR